MKDEVRVAAAQMDIKRDVKVNLERMRRLVGRIAAEGPVDLVVFPELANCGYVKALDRNFGREYFKMAEKVPGVFTEGLGEIAREYRIFIVSGMLEEHPRVPASVYNSGVLIGPGGDVLGVHHKMHLPDEEKHYFYPGNTFKVVDTELGKIGFQVCADASYPEVSRVLALMGAEIVCTVHNGPRRKPGTGLHYRGRPACRALENGVYYIACNRVGTEEDEISYLGASSIAAPDGQLIARAPVDVEHVMRATLRAEVLEQERARRPLLSGRRPELYGAIAEKY
ncbi:MAG: carbon-nitrogen hydrolase family protein [Chloroflexi bacterium]|nr:carbon-nitrogen hydrolase family protein [Chloroflexota bacterium]